MLDSLKGTKGPESTHNADKARTSLRKKDPERSCEWGGRGLPLRVEWRKCFLLNIREDRKAAKEAKWLAAAPRTGRREDSRRQG